MQNASSERQAREALQAAEQALGPDHPDVAQILENLAALYSGTDRVKEAEALEERAAALHLALVRWWLKPASGAASAGPKPGAA